MHSACSGYNLLDPHFATFRTDQTCSHRYFPPRCRRAASFQRAAEQIWRRELLQAVDCQALDHRTGNLYQLGYTPAVHRRRAPAVPSRSCQSRRPKTSLLAKQKVAKTRVKAFQYDVINNPEPSSKPRDIFKLWLYSRIPILRNEELISRTAWTLMVIAIARFGQQLRLPYVDANIALQGGTSRMLPHLLLVTPLSVQILLIP